MEKRLLVPTKNAKGILENLSSGMPMAEWKDELLQFKTPAASENELNEEGAKVSFMQRICVTVFLICYPCRLD